jgi:hypothetical protein
MTPTDPALPAKSDTPAAAPGVAGGDRPRAGAKRPPMGGGQALPALRAGWGENLAAPHPATRAPETAR